VGAKIKNSDFGDRMSETQEGFLPIRLQMEIFFKLNKLTEWLNSLRLQQSKEEDFN